MPIKVQQLMLQKLWSREALIKGD